MCVLGEASDDWSGGRVFPEPELGAREASAVHRLVPSSVVVDLRSGCSDKKREAPFLPFLSSPISVLNRC